MKDQIIAAYLKDFLNQFSLTGLDEGSAFEYFVNYCVVSKHNPETFEPEEVSVGGGGDLGIDGLALLVNEHLVLSNADVDFFKSSLRRLDVQFVFIQAKTSAAFQGGDIGTFISGVRQFFNSSLPNNVNEAISALHSIKQYIFESSIDMDKSPACKLYYVTTGTWTDDTQLRSRIDQGTNDLRQTGLFSAVEFIPLDSEALKRLYREVHHKVIREFDFDKHTILPQITGVQEAYIGIVPCIEYLKLIKDDEGALNRRLFYDNVRDFQGHNPVNREIEATVKDSTTSDRFALLNNGITIVARDVNKVGAKFRLKEYQIVNGCQTSHILYLNRQLLRPNIFLPLKLIVTVDSEVTNQIIQGTNRQTEVKLEAFESLAPFQKKLEEFYLALGRDRKEPLYYERRSKQYDHLQIRRERIVTLTTQVKSFVAMFLNEPHSTHRYYGELLSSYRNRLFSDSHSEYPYFVSAVTLATVENLFADGELPRDWRPIKYQLLMVFRIQNEPSDSPPLNSKAINQYCDGLMKILDDKNHTKEILVSAGQLVASVRQKKGPWREPPERTRVFTNALVEAAARGAQEQPATTTTKVGTVEWFSEIKGWGFITEEDGSSLFVHYTGIAGYGYRTLEEGDGVRYAVAENEKGRRAVDVERIAPRARREPRW